MKVIILIIIIFAIFLLARFFKNWKTNENLEKKQEKVVDLEKDPKTDEYKPKD